MITLNYSFAEIFISKTRLTMQYSGNMGATIDVVKECINKATNDPNFFNYFFGKGEYIKDYDNKDYDSPSYIWCYTVKLSKKDIKYLKHIGVKA